MLNKMRMFQLQSKATKDQQSHQMQQTWQESKIQSYFRNLCNVRKGRILREFKVPRMRQIIFVKHHLHLIEKNLIPHSATISTINYQHKSKVLMRVITTNKQRWATIKNEIVIIPINKIHHWFLMRKKLAGKNLSRKKKL